MTSAIVRTITYVIPGKGTLQVNQLADGTYHGCGTTHIYTAAQFEAARAKMLALGATEN